MNITCTLCIPNLVGYLPFEDPEGVSPYLDTEPRDLPTSVTEAFSWLSATRGGETTLRWPLPREVLKSYKYYALSENMS